MSTIQRAKRKTSRFRWTLEQFQKAADDGWFGDRKVELLDGDVIKDDLLKGTDVALLVEVSRKTYARDRGWNMTKHLSITKL